MVVSVSSVRLSGSDASGVSTANTVPAPSRLQRALGLDSRLVFRVLALCHELGTPDRTGKSHLAQAIGQAAIQQGYRVLYRETHHLLEEIAETTIDDTRKEHMELLASVPLLIIDDLGMRNLPLTAAEDLLEIVMRRYERASTLLTSNRPH